MKGLFFGLALFALAAPLTPESNAQCNGGRCNAVGGINANTSVSSANVIRGRANVRALSAPIPTRSVQTQADPEPAAEVQQLRQQIQELQKQLKSLERSDAGTRQVQAAPAQRPLVSLAPARQTTTTDLTTGGLQVAQARSSGCGSGGCNSGGGGRRFARR